MFSIPVIKSKLIMPQNPNYFSDSVRIANLCDNIHKMRVVEIIAPPGYGKTSLVIRALSDQTRNSRICWYCLDEQDIHMPVFYLHLIETLFPEEDKYSIYREGFKEFGDIESQTVYINRLICSNLYDFTKRYKQARNYLVFDDYHMVSEKKEIQASIRWLIDNLPNNFTIIVAGRTDNGLVTEKQKLENNTLKIGYKELAFQKDEINMLINQIRKDETYDCQHIMEMTEGWVAGILLMLRSDAKSLTEERKKANLKNELAYESNFTYFAHELLDNIDADLLNFLIGVSILDEFNEEAANSVLKIRHSDKYIKACESKGLFLQITTAEVPIYRFHPLFRNTMIKMCKERLSKEEIVQNQIAAAEYFCSTQNLGKAIEYFLAASRTDLAADMISKAGTELSSLEAMGKLRLLFDKIPRETLEVNPGLMYMKSFMYQNGEEESRRLLNKALTMFEQAGITDMVLATLFSLLAFHLFKNNALEAVDVLERACKIASRQEEQEYENLIPVFQFVIDVWTGKTEEADRLLRCLHMEEIHLNYVWTVFMYSCIHYIVIGKFDLAEKSIEGAMNMAMVAKADTLKGFSLMFQFITAFYHNDEKLFESSVRSLLEISERYNVLYMVAFVRVFIGLKENRKQDTDRAYTMLQTGINFFEQYGNKVLSSVFTMYLLLYQTVQGNRTELYIKAEKVFHTLSDTTTGFLFQELGEMLLGAVAIEAGNLETAERLLLHSMEISSRKNELLLLTTTCMHLANLYYKMEKIDEFEHFLRKALFIASSNKYNVFTGILTETFVKLAYIAVRRKIYSDYVHELILDNFGKNKVEFFEQAMNQNDLYSFVEDFMSSYRSTDECRRIIKVSFLGLFKLQINGVSVPESKFATKKHESILKYLLFNKNKHVSKEHLIELFWPDSDKKSGFASMRTAIYGIRKIFTEYGISNVRDSFIVESNGILYIEHPEYIDSDLEHFVAFDKKQKCMASDKERIMLLERMTELYGGNLLEEGRFEEWAFFDREEYKTIYFNAVSVLAKLYMKSAQHKKAEKLLLKALSFDPYHEEFGSLLIRNYILANQSERAHSYYKSYKEMLKKELEIEPGVEITKLFTKKTK